MAGEWNEGSWGEGLQKFAEMLYRDEVQVWRSAQEKRPNGSTASVRQPWGDPLPCRISRISSRKDAFNQELPQQELEYEARLYLAPHSDIVAGDLLDIRRGGSAWRRQYLAGDCFVYASHMEVPLRRSEEA